MTLQCACARVPKTRRCHNIKMIVILLTLDVRRQRFGFRLLSLFIRSRPSERVVRRLGVGAVERDNERKNISFDSDGLC